MVTNKVTVKNADVNVKALMTALMHASDVKVGYPAETTGAIKHTDTDLYMAELAAIHELGGGRVPPRPFMRQGANIFITRRGLLVPLIKRMLSGKTHVDAVMISAGNYLKSAIESAVQRQDFVPLAAATVNRKGSTEILVDSGEMLDNLDVHLDKL